MKTQGLRLQYVLNELQITPYRFSKLLGYKSPDTIYHILNGKQMVSTNMQKRIRELNLEINENWIITGIGSPFIRKLTKGSYGNEYVKGSSILYPARLMHEDIRVLAKKIASEIFWNSDTVDYEISYKISGIEGLEFLFTTLYYDKVNKEKYPEKYYSLIMSPEWKIISFFDFWRINSPSRRCQNLLEITNESRKKYIEAFETKTREFLDELDDKYIQRNPIELSNDNFRTLYINYPQHM